MKKLTRRMLTGLITCSAVLAFLSGATGKDKPKSQARAPIMAIAENGTTWVAGEAKFVMTGDRLNVTVDVASGVPNAQFGVYVETDPDVLVGMEIPNDFITDDRGDLNGTESYIIYAQDPFDVWVSVWVKGSTVVFTTEQKPVTVDPRN